MTGFSSSNFQRLSHVFGVNILARQRVPSPRVAVLSLIGGAALGNFDRGRVITDPVGMAFRSRKLKAGAAALTQAVAELGGLRGPA